MFGDKCCSHACVECGGHDVLWIEPVLCGVWVVLWCGGWGCCLDVLDEVDSFFECLRVEVVRVLLCLLYELLRVVGDCWVECL